MSSNSQAIDEFNFNITEIEILENGNKFIGTNRGKITTSDGVEIEADEFVYIKDINLLNANGNIKIIDKIENYLIFTENLIYKKNENIILTKNNSKAISPKDQIEILANDFVYDRSKNIINAKNNVIIEDRLEDYKIYSEFATYELNKEIIFTKGQTTGQIHSKYDFKSEDVTFFKKVKELKSQKKMTIKDKFNLYNIKNFTYNIESGELKGEDLLITSNYSKPSSDNFFFSSAIVNLNSNDFIAKDTLIKIHKDIFDDSNNDPRVMGVSSNKKGNITEINKAVFTSCGENDKCPPWSIQANQITHDKDKKQLIYDNAILRIYDVPIFYFPKFFHPDPTVNRQSGFLQPRINKSKILGNSISSPYYYVISESKDFTLSPTFFDSGINSFQGEYRQENLKSSSKVDFGFVNKFKSKYSSKKKNILHLFAKSVIDLDYENFTESKLDLYLEKTNKDTYIKIFDSYLLNNDTKPKDGDVLSSGVDLTLRNEKFNLEAGLTSNEDLNKQHSDRYQFILPYFRYDTVQKNDLGRINFYSSGNSTLQNTNNLRTRVINDINFSSVDFLSSKTGFKSNFNIYFKNVNTVAKEDAIYKSSPQSELMNIFEFNTSYPVIKETENTTQLLTPKASFRFNPGDMKSHSNADRAINVNNIFSVDRFNLEDSLESGRSLTLGLDYKNRSIEDNDEINVKLASVIRDEVEDTIPEKTTLNKKKSYIFGSVDYNKNNFLNFEYNFAADNNLGDINYHDLGVQFSLNNFVTDFNFIEENDVIGSAHIIENTSTINFDEKNFLSFKTRRNKEINLTEYYDLIYEYKNDCLVAGLKFKKTFYQDRDLEPSEDLFFYLTLIPLTTIEQGIDENLYK